MPNKEHFNQEALKEIGVRISQARKAAKLTQKQFSEKIGLSEKYISKIEKGGNITLNTLINMCNVLEIDSVFLITGNPILSSSPLLLRKASTLTEAQYHVIEQTIDIFISDNKQISAKCEYTSE